MTTPDSPATERPRKRPALAALSGLAIAAIVGGLVVYRWYTEARLARIVACKGCGAVPKPVESGWVEVQPGDAWAVSLGSQAGMVLVGPARFEVAGKQRVALSSGSAYLTQGADARTVILLPRGSAAGIEGASVATGGPGAIVGVAAAAEGNSVAAFEKQALAELRTGAKSLNPGEHWESGKAAAPAAPDATLSAWLDQLRQAP